MARFKAGDIVIVGWRGGALPEEPNRLRPAIVVEDDALFDPDYPNVLVVPMTSDSRLAIPVFRSRSHRRQIMAARGHGSRCVRQ